MGYCIPEKLNLHDKKAEKVRTIYLLIFHPVILIGCNQKINHYRSQNPPYHAYTNTHPTQNTANAEIGITRQASDL